MLENFKPYKLTIGSPAVSVTDNGITFNASAVVRIGKPAYVVFYISEKTKQIAIMPCDKSNENATKFFNPNTNMAKYRKAFLVRWNYKELTKDIVTLMGWNLSCFTYNAPGVYHSEENIIIFDLDRAVATKVSPPAGSDAKDA